MIKKIFLLILLVGIFNIFYTQIVSANGLVYEIKTISENKIGVTLKFSNPKEAKGFVITTYSPQITNNGKVLNIGYKFDNKGKKTAYKEYSLLGAIEPVRIVLYNVSDPSWLPYKDIKGIEAEKHIRHLHDASIIDGLGDGKYRPNDFITRAEFAELICKALKFGGTIKNSKGLKDIDKTKERNYILTVVEKGILKGYDDKTFRPDVHLSTAEVCVCVSKYFTFKTVRDGFYLKLKTDKPYSSSVKKIFDLNILNVNDSLYKNFNEESNISRANCAIIISRALSTY